MAEFPASRRASSQPLAQGGRFLNRWDRGGGNPPAHPRRGHHGDTAPTKASSRSQLSSLESKQCCWGHVKKMCIHRREEVAGPLPPNFSVPREPKSSRRQGGQHWHLQVPRAPVPEPSGETLLEPPPRPADPGVLAVFSPAAGSRLDGGGLLTCSASGKRGVPFCAGPRSALEKASAKQALYRSCRRNHIHTNRSIRYPSPRRCCVTNEPQAWRSRMRPEGQRFRLGASGLGWVCSGW